MNVIRDISNLRQAIKSYAGQTCSLVPTMGALHEGHLSLVDLAFKETEVVMATVFVNPLQFDDASEVERYPRAIDVDLNLLADRGVDLVFCPDVKELVPESFQTSVVNTKAARGLCGASRPGHFDGVCTIMLRFLLLFSPDCVVMGAKDYQQVRVIKALVRDLDLGCRVIEAPVFREPDGLAASSRNRYLSDAERDRAIIGFHALRSALDAFQAGESNAAKLCAIVRQRILASVGCRLDYVEIRDSNFETLSRSVASGSRMLLAFWLGKTRLIDNIELKL